MGGDNLPNSLLLLWSTFENAPLLTGLF